jgi:hypothetical protein
MPVTAKLSKQFYDRFGDQIANELVDWFNKVDDTYRTELRELNELNFTRFDAKLEQRIAEQGATLRSEIAELGVSLSAEISGLDKSLRAEISGLDKSLHSEMAGLEKSLRTEIAETKVALHAAIADMRADLMRWLFGLWATQMVALTGVILAIVLRGR